MVEVQITVGRFSLRVGGPHGTRADPAPEPSPTERKALAKALRSARPESPSTAEHLAGGIERAEDVTASVERAAELATALAKGLTLDPKALETQLNALLDAAERADRDGRFDDALRLARALVVLLALVPRWLALVEVLRRAASAAHALGDEAAEGWARHEIGTFSLGADDARAATDQLVQALRLRESAGDKDGVEVTLHNMQLLPLVPQSEAISMTIRRHPVVAGLAVVAMLAGAGGLAAAAANRFSDDSVASSTAESTSTRDTATDEDGITTDGEETTTGGTTTEEGTTTTKGDTTAPIVEIAVPDYLSREVVIPATARDEGGSGVAEVVFEVAPAGTDARSQLGRVTAAPYSVPWDTVGFDDGPYVLRAVATDVDGNRGFSETEAVVDNTSPSAVLTQLEGVAFETVTLAAAAEDGNGSGVDSVRFELAGTNVGTAGLIAGPFELLATVGEPPYEVEFDTTTKKDGNYVLRAVAVDRAANVGESKPESVRINQPEG